MACRIIIGMLFIHSVCTITFRLIKQTVNYILPSQVPTYDDIQVNPYDMLIQVKPMQHQYDDLVSMRLEQFDQELIQRMKKHNLHFK